MNKKTFIAILNQWSLSLYSQIQMHDEKIVLCSKNDCEIEKVHFHDSNISVKAAIDYVDNWLDDREIQETNPWWCIAFKCEDWPGVYLIIGHEAQKPQLGYCQDGTTDFSWFDWEKGVRGREMLQWLEANGIEKRYMVNKWERGSIKDEFAKKPLDHRFSVVPEH